jgi:hypothetical protein
MREGATNKPEPVVGPQDGVDPEHERPLADAERFCVMELRAGTAKLGAELR